MNWVMSKSEETGRKPNPAQFQNRGGLCANPNPYTQQFRQSIHTPTTSSYYYSRVCIVLAMHMHSTSSTITRIYLLSSTVGVRMHTTRMSIILL